MTISPFMGLQTALRGLIAEQTAIDTTGHNIANANTPGYSRQTADLTESTPFTVPAFSNVTGAGVQIGTGVDVATINRVRNSFLDIQYRAQNTTSNDSSTRAGILDQVQTGLAEPSDHGIASQLSAFWNAWSDVANAPQSQSARQALINSATTLANSFNQFDTQLSTIQAQAQQQYNDLTDPTTGRVVSDANQIKTLNQSISAAMAAGQNPNDLLDRRDSLIDDLSSLASVSVSPDTTHPGMVNIDFGGASTPLVSGLIVTWPQSLGANPGGELGALTSLAGAGGQIASYRTQLDGVASQLINSVNTLHGTPAFFTGTSAATIAVGVTAAQVNTGTPPTAAGANDIALAIAGLRGGLADQQYASFVSSVGSDVKATQSTEQISQSVLSAIDDQRKSVSGVSLDEEMSNLVQFQRGYQASARMLTTVDQMLDTLINRTGSVGL